MFGYKHLLRKQVLGGFRFIVLFIRDFGDGAFLWCAIFANATVLDVDFYMLCTRNECMLFNRTDCVEFNEKKTDAYKNIAIKMAN